MGAETELAAFIAKQSSVASSRSVSHLLEKSTQWQLKVKLRGPSRERNWESVREERILSATRERTETSLGPAGTNRAEVVVAPMAADGL